MANSYAAQEEYYATRDWVRDWEHRHDLVTIHNPKPTGDPERDYRAQEAAWMRAGGF